MTPERKKWWDSLPKREKMLRKKICEIKSGISWAKYSSQFVCFTTPESIKLIIAGIKIQKVTLTALKHELDRTTEATYVGHLGHYEGAVPIYRCEKCGNMFENFEQSYCCWCGRKIVGWK